MNHRDTEAQRKTDLYAVAFIIGVLTLWFWEVLFAGQAYYTRDIFNYHYPMKWIVRQAILARELPLWSPNFGSGQPLAANPAYEVFYPMQWLTLLPDFHYGMTLHIVVHFFIAAIGLYALLRSMDAGWAAALVGAFAFSLGGPMISLIRTLPFLFAVAWAPWIFLFVRRSLITRSRRDVLLAALFGGMQALVAEPTIILQTWFIAGVYVLYRRKVKRDWAVIAVIVACVFVVAAAQLVPMLDFFRDTVRSEGIDFDTGVAKWSLPTARLLELFYPRLYESLFNQNGVRWLSTMYPQGEPYVSNFYIGFIISILFAAGILAWRRGSGLALGAFATLFIIAIGNQTPVLRLLYDIGLFKTMRFPEKFFIGATLVAVIWGALALQQLLNGDTRTRKAVIYVTCAWFVIALFMLLGAASMWESFWFMTFLRGAILLAIVFLMWRRASAIWPAALVALAILDMLNLRTINDTITRDYFTPPEVTKELDARRQDYRIFHRAEWAWLDSVPNADDYFRPAEWRWWSLRNSLMPRNGAFFGYRYAMDRDYDQTFLRRTAEFLIAMRTLRRDSLPGWEEQFMAMTNSWYSGTFRSFRSEAARLGDRHADVHPVDFHPSAAQYPRYYFADQIETITNSDDFIARLSAQRWSPRVAFLETTSFTPAPGRVLSVAETMRTARIDVEAAGRALLVLSVTGDRHWKARIDGAPAKLQYANVAFQALEIPAGRHKVEMEYSNPLVVPSAIISLLAVIVIAIVAATTRSLALPQQQNVRDDVVVKHDNHQRRKNRKT